MNAAEPKHLQFLDSLRGLAILGVVVVHCGMLTQQGGAIWNWCWFGQRGVQLFFLVSAYTLFLGWYGVRRAEPTPMRNFFIRRFFRIAPMFWVALATSLLFFGIGPREGAPRGLAWTDIAQGITLTHGISPAASNAVVVGGWSVGVEAIFYLSLPLLFRRVTGWRGALILGAAWALAARLMLGAAFSTRWGHDNAQFLCFSTFPAEFPVFCMGIAAFFLVRDYGARAASAFGARPVAYALLALSAALIWWNVPLYQISLSRLYTSSAALVPLVIALAIYPVGLLVNRVTAFLGKVSYSIYLCHFFVIFWLQPWATARIEGGDNQRHPLLFLAEGVALVLATSVPLAWVLWRCIEVPGIALGKRIIAARTCAPSITPRLTPATAR